MALPELMYVTRIPLRHAGDCHLIGILPDLTIYVEESYGDGWVAQSAVRLDGAVVATADEGDEQDEFTPLVLPPGLTRPAAPRHRIRAALNFSGPRHRGQREAERLPDVMRALRWQDKMALAGCHGLPPAAPLILGLAESYVLADARLTDEIDLVCRRLRIAYAVVPPGVDADGLPYDYDTATIYMAHTVEVGDGLDADSSVDLSVDLSDGPRLPGAVLHRPMDCQAYREHLFIADGGEAERRSAVHVWRVR